MIFFKEMEVAGFIATQSRVILAVSVIRLATGYGLSSLGAST
jgi:hypothetical protein